MKILLDHNLDRRLKGFLPQFETSTTQEEGWADLVNGELISLAEATGFDVLLTADANIKKQQSIATRKIAILVLRAFNNRLTTHKEMVPDIVVALEVLRAGEIVEVFHRDLRTSNR